MMYGSLAWPIFTAIGVLFVLATWKLLRRRDPDGEHRVYLCGCGTRLVKECNGPLQRHDGWVPGVAPRPLPKAKVP